jgi:hypothetical protein
MKLIFTGSDVQLLNEFPKQLSNKKLPYVLFYREWVRQSLRFVEEIWVVHEHLIPELNKFGITEKIKIVGHPVEHNEKYPKVKHRGFNVLYYCPDSEDQEWNDWIYGWDMFNKVTIHYQFNKDINFIFSYGEHDMRETYPITDFLLRCNNHDGDARMVQEAKIQDIPYYWSWENPNFEMIIKSIEDARTGRL